MITTHIATLIIAALCCSTFLFIWRCEGAYIFFTPFLLVSMNEFLRILPAFFYSVYAVTPDDIAVLGIGALAYLCLALGFAWYAYRLRLGRAEAERFIHSPIVLEDDRYVLFAVLGLTLTLIAAGTYLYQGFPSVGQALLGLLTGEQGSEVAQYVASSRKELTKGHVFGGAYRGQGMLRLFMRTGWPFVTSICFVYALKRKSIAWGTLFCLMFFLSFLYVAGDGTRSPFLYTLIIITVTFSYIYVVRLRHVAIIMAALIAIAIGSSLYSPKLYYALQTDNAIAVIFKKIAERILIGNSINDIYAIDLVNEGALDLRLGDLHLRDLTAMLPGTGGGKPFAYELYQITSPGARGTTYMTGTYITKIYVDFGVYGVVLFNLLIGATLAFLQKQTLRIRKDVTGILVAAVITTYAADLVLVGPIGLVSALGVFVVVYLLHLAFYRLGRFLLDPALACRATPRSVANG